MESVFKQKHVTDEPTTLNKINQIYNKSLGEMLCLYRKIIIDIILIVEILYQNSNPDISLHYCS